MIEILKQAWPIFVSQLVVAGYGVVDTFMVGHLSTSALASVGLSTNIFTTVFILFSSILFVLVPFMSGADSSNKYNLVGEYVRQGFWLILILSPISMYLIREPQLFFMLLSVDDAMKIVVSKYLFYLALSIPALLLFKVFFCFCSAIMEPKVLIVFSIIGLVVKLPLTYVLVNGGYGIVQMGAVGCAISTCIVSYIEAIIAFVFVLKSSRYKQYKIFSKWSWLDTGILCKFLTVGIPIGVSFIIDFSAITIIGVLVINVSLQLAGAYRIVLTVAYIFYLMPMSIGNAASVFVARNADLNNHHEAIKYANSAFALTIIVATVVCCSLVFFREDVVAFFTPFTDVATLATSLLIIMAIFHFFDAIVIVTCGVLRGYKKTLFPTLVYGISMWGIGLGLGYYLTFKNTPVWLDQNYTFFSTLAVGVTVGSILMFGYYSFVKIANNNDKNQRNTS